MSLAYFKLTTNVLQWLVRPSKNFLLLSKDFPTLLLNNLLFFKDKLSFETQLVIHKHKTHMYLQTNIKTD